MQGVEAFFHYYGSVLISKAIMLLTLTAGVLIVSLSPLGRNLIRFLRERRDERAIHEQLLAELEQLRATLVEVTERLDSTERLLSDTGESRPPILPAFEPRPQVITPH